MINAVICQDTPISGCNAVALHLVLLRDLTDPGRASAMPANFAAEAVKNGVIEVSAGDDVTGRARRNVRSQK